MATFVLVDVGYKSEGTIPLNEWEEDEDPPQPGEIVKVLDRRRRRRIRPHRRIARHDHPQQAQGREGRSLAKVMENVHESDIVTGTVIRKIKGGLLVDIGVNVFLPASQVDIRRPADIGDYIGRTIQCIVLKIDDARRNIVVSRRALIETERAEKKSQLLVHLGSRPTSQGRGQEHRRVRRVRRSGRHRWPVAHHRYELGPHRPSLGDGGHRPRNRSDDSAHRPRKRKNRPGPEAKDAQPVGIRRTTSTRSARSSRARSST